MTRTPRAGALRAPCLALIALAAFAISTLASTARAQILLDNFNDNSLSAVDWTSYATSPSAVQLTEKNTRLEFSTLSNPAIVTNTWNHAEISSTWGIGTQANIQVKMDVNFVAQVGSVNSTANTGLMILFSPIDNVASSNGIADGFGLQIGSELFGSYNYRKVAVVRIENGQPIVLKVFYNNGTNTFSEYGNSANYFTLTSGATVYVSYVVATQTLQFGTSTNTSFFSQRVAYADDLWVTLKRPVRLSLGGYALGPTKPLSASIDNVYLQQGVRSYRPTGCSAADGISTTGIALTWTAAASASSYNIYRSEAGGLAYRINSNPITSTSYTDVPSSSSNPLVAGVNYTYVVRAVSTAGESESSNADVGWFNIGPATGLSATDGTLTTGVKLTWTAPTAPSAFIEYKVMRAIGTAAASEIGTSPVTNYLDTTAVAGTLYTYSIIATTSAGDSLTASNTNTGWRLIGVPIITTVSPASGPIAGGTAFTITGTNLTGATSVKVNGVAATSVVVVSPTTITAKSPTGTTGSTNVVANVAVSTLGGTVTKASAFTFAAAPTITSVSPASGPLTAGTAFTITGTNFITGATSVKVNGVAATSVIVVSATSITAKTPVGTAGAKSVAVTTAGGTATKASGFTYVTAPTITTVSPTSGPLAAGTAFTITGTNLTGATSVKVNGVAATNVVVVSATSITAKTPAGTAGAKSVAVTTVGGTATKASAFTYVAAPTITTVSPASGPLAAGTAFTITGTNLTGATSVKVNGVAATSVVVVSATSITAKTPVGTAGAKSVAVTTVGGTATKASAFTYVAAPTITTVSPASGPLAAGTAFTITGTNLTGATSVKVNGVAATSVVVVSATSITAKTPTGTAGAKSVAVTTVGGTATKASAFTYIAAPTITAISPTSGPTSGNTAITITGTNLTGATSVKVNGVAATSVVVVSATSITARTPAGTVGAKSVTVTTVGGTATKTSGFTYTASFAGDEITDGNNNGGGVVAGKLNKPNDTTAGQLGTNAAAETVAAAPMGVQLYLQTIITQPDADVDCANTQSSDAPDATAGTVTAIDLDLNGEADICQLRGGDLDLNGVIDNIDMGILLDMIGVEPLHGIGDMDANGVIDSADMGLLLLKMNESKLEPIGFDRAH